MTEEMLICGRKVRCELCRKNVKNLNLHVRPDGTVSVSAPPRASRRQIEDFIDKNGKKILEVLNRQKESEKTAPMPSEFRDGEHFTFLGRIYPLHVVKADRNGTEFSNGELKIYVKDPSDRAGAKRLFEAWLLGETKKRLTAVCRMMWPSFSPPLKAMPGIRFRKMRSCWGNCRPESGILTFNSSLAALPPECIECVAAHEFTHFLHPDHSRDFYRSFTDFMPDREKREKVLSKYSAVLR